MISLFIPCILVTIFTYKLLLTSKSKIDTNILKMMFICQKILLLSNIFKKTKILKIFQLLYSITLILAIIYLEEQPNILFVFCLLLISLFYYRYKENDCLFNNYGGNNIKFYIIMYFGLIICLYKLLNIK